ncbi:hypothetical protein WH47_04605 [Habropoda laboriosa]|uniref:Uncharacterized protein n=1 Tax=Habropoda laboriosa TaxID=597456 RepID=A0A0L7R2A7_9HYME|nr:hypothetical protein WH47_04605 [Habropoda laboriosa]
MGPESLLLRLVSKEKWGISGASRFSQKTTTTRGRYLEDTLLVKKDVKVNSDSEQRGIGSSIEDVVDERRKGVDGLLSSTSQSEHKEMKDCKTSSDVWQKLEVIVKFLKHLRRCFDALDKLNEMNVVISQEKKA